MQSHANQGNVTIPPLSQNTPMYGQKSIESIGTVTENALLLIKKCHGIVTDYDNKYYSF